MAEEAYFCEACFGVFSSTRRVLNNECPHCGARDGPDYIYIWILGDWLDWYEFPPDDISIKDEYRLPAARQRIFAMCYDQNYDRQLTALDTLLTERDANG